MYGSFARRAALALGALAVVASVAVGPTTASAESLFQGALTTPSPTPTQPTWPSAANPFEARPSLPSPTPSIPDPPQGQYSQIPGQSQGQYSQFPGSPHGGQYAQYPGPTQNPHSQFPDPTQNQYSQVPGPPQGQHPSFTAPSLGSQPPMGPGPSRMPPPQPDVKVTSLGIVRGASGESYSFRVMNVGKGIAPEVTITRQAVVKRKGEKTWVRNEVSTYAHHGGLRPGEEIVVEVTCPANDRQFCDVGSVLADVVGAPEDVDPANNHMVELGDIKG